MNFLFNFSLRYKIPLWGGVLIVTSAVFVAGSLMFRAYAQLKEDLFISADSLGRSLARTLVQPLLDDNLAQAAAIVRAPLHGPAPHNAAQVDTLFVLDRTQRIYVTTDPGLLIGPAQADAVSEEFAGLLKAIDRRGSSNVGTFEVTGPGDFHFVTPVADGGTELGHVVLVYPKAAFEGRFLDNAAQAGGIALLVLAVLLPINWYWGQRTARPLMLLADRMDELGRSAPQPLDAAIYPYRDEVGRLFEAYGRMVKELNEKGVLAREMVHSERLAAVGRLSAGIAHEINNPLAGLLTVVSTLKMRAGDDARTAKAVDLLERGLMQVRDTVAALLVETRVKTRDLSAQDIEDVRTLLGPQAHRKAIEFTWNNAIAAAVPLPATSVRQIMINLLLNAIQAADTRGRAQVDIRMEGDILCLAVTNDGRFLTPEQREHLFEPFVSAEGSGQGLGLWVTYQIVTQLGGRIQADSQPGRTTFSVRLPTVRTGMR